jgi:predicted O-methyltransferase YrrM
MKPYRTGDNVTGLRDFAKRCNRYFRPPPMTRERDPRILEIGSFIGDSARIFIEEIRPQHIVCVDPWDEQMPSYHVEGGEIQSAFVDNIAELASRAGCGLTMIAKRSGDFFAGTRANGNFDLVYVDAVHTFEAITSDIVGALAMLRPDGILAGHDFDPVRFPGVVEAVHAALKSGPRFSHVEIYRDTTWALVPAEPSEG